MLKDKISKEIYVWNTIGAPLDSCTPILNPAQSIGEHWGMVTRAFKPRDRVRTVCLGEPVEQIPGTAGWVGTSPGAAKGPFLLLEGKHSAMATPAKSCGFTSARGKGAWETLICHVKGLCALVLSLEDCKESRETSMKLRRTHC